MSEKDIRNSTKKQKTAELKQPLDNCKWVFQKKESAKGKHVFFAYDTGICNNPQFSAESENAFTPVTLEKIINLERNFSGEIWLDDIRLDNYLFDFNDIEKNILEQAINLMNPAKNKTVAIMYYLENKSIKNICQNLKISKSDCYCRKNSARKGINSILKKHHNDIILLCQNKQPHSLFCNGLDYNLSLLLEQNKIKTLVQLQQLMYTLDNVDALSCPGNKHIRGIGKGYLDKLIQFMNEHHINYARDDAKPKTYKLIIEKVPKIVIKSDNQIFDANNMLETIKDLRNAKTCYKLMKRSQINLQILVDLGFVIEHEETDQIKAYKIKDSEKLNTFKQDIIDKQTKHNIRK